MASRTPYNLILRLWIPLVLITTVIAVGFIYFVRLSELQLILDHERSEMREVARGVALTTDLSFKYSDPEAIDIAVQQIAENNSNYMVAVYQRNETGGIIVLSAWPPNLAVRNSLAQTEKYLSVTERINSNQVAAGYVSVFLDRNSFEQIGDSVVDQISYLVVAAGSIFCFIVLMLLIRIGRPIREVTLFTELLLKGTYSGHLETTDGNYEIGRLKTALNNLKVTLSKEKSRNKELTSGLEFQISKKTTELKTVLDRLNAAQKIAQIGNFVYWIDQDYWEVSHNMDEILGEGSQSLDTMDSFIDYVHPDFKSMVETSIKKSIGERSKIRLDFQIGSDQFDKPKWVTLVGEVLVSGANNVYYLTGTIQDITSRKSIESQVEQLSLVARLTNNGVLFTDSMNRIIWANESMCRITGYELEEMLGKQPSMFQSTKTSAEVKSYIRSRLSERKNVRVEIENISKEGRDYWIELHIEPIIDDYDRVKGFLAIQIDVTQRKYQQEEMQRTLDKQQELNQMKSRFLTLTSHEFRTPLTSIQATTEVLEILLESNTPLDLTKVRRYTKRISNELERLTMLLNDILSIERFEAGRIPFNPMEIDLVELLKDLLDSRILLANDQRLVGVVHQGTPRKIKVDRHLISQIVTNLATNALKYSPGKPEPVLTVSWGENEFQLSMCDRGIGIPESDQKNLFQTFFRASNVENIQGTGLGLVIVKQFTEIHAGKISVKSVVDQGTCVNLEFSYQKLNSLQSNIA